MPNIRSAARDAALAAGDMFYFTGKPCKRGHISPRYVMTKICLECGKTIYQVKDRDDYRYQNTFYRQFISRKQKAIKAGIPFTIEFNQLEKPEFCPIFNTKLNYGWSGLKCRDPNKATIDKLIPELGYVSGNVFIISWRANKLKSDMSINELEKIMKYIKERLNGQSV
jgi:hypothetical protein